MLHKKVYVFSILLLLATVVLAACSSSPSSFPTGKFYLAGGEKTDGVEFKSDGSFNFFGPDGVQMEGTYKVEGDVYTETSNTAPADDPACKEPSQYKWSFDGSTLRFSLVKDDCGPRRSAYTDNLYVK